MLKKRKKFFIFNAALLQIFLLIGMSVAVAVLLSGEVKAQITTTAPLRLSPHTVGQELIQPQPTTTLPASIPPPTPPPKIPIPTGITKVPSATTDIVYAPKTGLGPVKLPSGETGDLVTLTKHADGSSTVVLKGMNGQEITKTYNPADTAASFNNIGQGLTTPTQYTYSGVSTPFGKVLANSPVLGSLTAGIMYAAVVVGIVQLIGNLAGLSQPLTKSLSLAAGGGIIGGEFVYGIIQKSLSTTPGGAGGFANIFRFGSKQMNPSTAGFIWGAALAIAIFVLTYKKEKKEMIKFTCLPYEPPSGGAKCEECNKDPFRPCSLYRCKSLGQACELLNPGTKEEQCAWVSRNDVKSPTITPDSKLFAPSDLNLKFEPDKSIRPPAIGVKIVSPTGSGGCVPAFTPLEFGFSTDEPAQCVVSLNHTSSFDETLANGFYVGDNSYFVYNHTQKMKLPNENLMAPLLQNDGTFGLFVRCKDANGNYNVDEYSFKFCVEKGPDTTPPVVEGFSIPSGSYITFNKDNLDIDMYVNEPAECKWSTESKEYNLMENTMTCGLKTYEINADLMYVCSTKLTGIKDREDNKFYFRCLDQPEAIENGSRNVNLQSKEYIVKGSRPLDIISVKPNETISGSTDVVSVDLEVETSNGAEGNGNANCMISPDGTVGSYIEMFETGSYKHKQTYNLVGNDYTYFFRCIDAGGNSAENRTSFKVIVDKDSPKITRVYKDEALKIVTDENAECVYSTTTCNYQFKDGKKMEYPKADVRNNLFAEWKENGIYYIKCKDDYQNQPDESKCSIVVRAVDLASKSS